MRPLMTLAAALLLAAGCQQAQPVATPATMDLVVHWSGADICARRSPAFTLRNIPAGTATLKFAMSDMDVPTFDHGGGTVPYAGSYDIPAEAFPYQGPCPPRGVSHHYRWTVEAFGVDGLQVLGSGAQTTLYP